MPKNTPPSPANLAAAPVKGSMGLAVPPGGTEPVEAGTVALPAGVLTKGGVVIGAGGAGGTTGVSSISVGGEVVVGAAGVRNLSGSAMPLSRAHVVGSSP